MALNLKRFISSSSKHGRGPDSNKKIVQLRDRLDDENAHGAADLLAEKDSLVLPLRKIKHVCRRVEQRGIDNLSNLIHSAQIMTSFMQDPLHERS